MLENKAAIVTGGASTIGRAIALALAAEGARIAVADIKTAEARQVADQITKGGGDALVVETDVRDSAQVEAMVAEVLEAFGAIDILVNDAGILGPQGPWTELSEGGFDLMVSVNFKGVYLCSKAVAPHMIRQKSGKIVNIASDAAKSAEKFNGIYSATKAAVASLTHSLALELGPDNITVNSVCPGAIKDSEIMEDVYRERSKWFGISPDRLSKDFRALVPLPYEITREDIADMVVFLASDRARSVTGQSINVTGGGEVH